MPMLKIDPGKEEYTDIGIEWVQLYVALCEESLKCPQMKRHNILLPITSMQGINL